MSSFCKKVLVIIASDDPCIPRQISLLFKRFHQFYDLSEILTKRQITLCHRIGCTDKMRMCINKSRHQHRTVQINHLICILPKLQHVPGCSDRLDPPILHTHCLCIQCVIFHGQNRSICIKTLHKFSSSFILFQYIFSSFLFRQPQVHLFRPAMFLSLNRTLLSVKFHSSSSEKKLNF